MAGVVLPLAFIVFSAVCSSAQDKKKESYKSLKSRSSQVNTATLLKQADAQKESNPALALNYVQEALAISTAKRDNLTEAKCYVLLGEINETIGEWNLALENYKRAHEILSTGYSKTTEYRETLHGLGGVYLNLGRYDEALRNYQELISLLRSGAEKAERQLDLSEVYYQMGNYNEALKATQEIEYSPKIVNTSFETRLQNQQAKIYARLNELDKTQDLYLNSLNQSRGNVIDPQQQQSIRNTKDEIADVLRSQKKYDEEITLRTQSIEYNLESKNFEEVARDKVAISETLAAKGENDASLKELEEAVGIAETLNNPREKANAFLALATQYEKRSRTRDALTAYRKYSEAVAEVEKFNEERLLEKSDLIIKQKEIEELTKDVSIGQREETIAQQTVARQRLVIYGLLLIILIVAITSYFIYKNALASRLANQLLALKSLRSQMNPHFIFNALNSVNHFIAQQDERSANKFLSEFSQLMRLVMENSQEDFISLQREQEILALYLKLEHYRFRDKFDYDIQIDESLNTEAIEIPPMLIQPYIENAVWHGLRYKENKGKLLLSFRKESNYLITEISDDGIGRKRSAELKTENQKRHNSTGLKNIEERLSIINSVYKSAYKVNIRDLDHDTGTVVQIFIPLNHRNHLYNESSYY